DIVRLQDGTFRVFADTTASKAAADALLNQVGTSRATIASDGNPTPANGKLSLTVQRVDGSVGTMTVDAHIDPATRQTMVAVQQANGSRGYMTVDAFNQAAKNVINNAVVVANNAVGFIQVGANAGAANAAIDYAARPRTTMIHVATDAGYVNVGVGTGGRGSMQAKGGVLKPYASGGIAAFANGGQALTPMASVASVVPRNTWRVVGDNMRVPESYIPWDGSSRSKRILAETNAEFGNTGGAPPAAPGIDYGLLAQMNAEAVSAAIREVFAN